MAMMLVPSHGLPGQEAPRPKQRLVLVGASIGKNWHFEQLDQRLGLAGYSFEYLGKDAFDKGPLIEELLRTSSKPHAVLIKECSTYFPGDEAQYRRAVAQWIDKLRRAGVEPILVTTAPIGEPSGYLERFKIGVKHLVGKPTWLDSITRYNDWLKSFAQEQRLAVFDLEAAVRGSERHRWLRADYAAGDSVHLNDTGYKAMDRAFAGFLDGWSRRLNQP